MSKHCSVEPSGNSKFSATWELTLKCNLDCSYCSKENHDNSSPHPTLEDCKQTVDFFIKYINLYMNTRPKENRVASIDIFGGESLFHPNILEILEYFRLQHEPYKDEWVLNLNIITNSVVKEKIWDRIVDYIHYFTVSYHIESSDEQLSLVRRNILELKKKNKLFHVSLLMHPKYWDKCLDIIEWCKENDVRILPRQIDHAWNQIQFWYSKEQAEWLRKFHQSGSTKEEEQCKPTFGQMMKYSVIKIVNMNNEGRQCCGGKPLYVDQDYNNSQTHIDNTFKGWTCGANYFFVHVKQLTREIFVNKDCLVNFEGEIGNIGTLDNYEEMLVDLEAKLNSDNKPVLTCVKSRCLCGICTPKAKTKEQFNEIFRKFHV